MLSTVLRVPPQIDKKPSGDMRLDEDINYLYNQTI